MEWCHSTTLGHQMELLYYVIFRSTVMILIKQLKLHENKANHGARTLSSHAKRYIARPFQGGNPTIEPAESGSNTRSTQNTQMLFAFFVRVSFSSGQQATCFQGLFWQVVSIPLTSFAGLERLGVMDAGCFASIWPIDQVTLEACWRTRMGSYGHNSRVSHDQSESPNPSWSSCQARRRISSLNERWWTRTPFKSAREVPRCPAVFRKLCLPSSCQNSWCGSLDKQLIHSLGNLTHSTQMSKPLKPLKATNNNVVCWILTPPAYQHSQPWSSAQSNIPHQSDQNKRCQGSCSCLCSTSSTKWMSDFAMWRDLYKWPKIPGRWLST